MRLIAFLTRLFPIWALLFSLLAFFFPDSFIPLKTYIIPLLMAIMFGMGMTLVPADFKRVFLKPGVIGIGVLLQYFLMPAAAFVISTVLDLPEMLLVGMVLVGSVPGGTASNVICFLAGADVALSISMTTISTILAVFATPLLTWLYIGETVPVPMTEMMISILKIVIIPVFLGVLINWWFQKHLQRIEPIFPFISMVAIVLIIAAVGALNQERMLTVGAVIVAAIMLHNAVGILSGYWIAKWMGYSRKVCRTIAIEVGMQNSGLGVALAVKYFSAAAALPGALFSIWHNLSGSLLAGYWQSQSEEKLNAGE